MCGSRSRMGGKDSGDGDVEVLALKSDVTKTADCKLAVGTALKEFGRLEILVKNVGIGGAAGTAVNVDMEACAKRSWNQHQRHGKMTKYCIPVMPKNEGEIRGNIVNIGSVAGLKGETPHLLYRTSKGAVVDKTRAIAARHAPTSIGVNCVWPE